ncbi:RNA-guided endonuclease InsQ/TnpB family protein [Limnospira indica]|uniref:Transposase, IS605 family, OrfB n=3 Tax=Limnospira TaxID=2596745 RepID=A0A9P1KK35_9CYAN|nr:RNA-guided endonuclease TnpB family protein [Limnospira indica]CDM97806.1 transposase, IS605 family, OrfB [Limnospira indica PCC 8005]
MIVLEFKARVKPAQATAIDDAIRTAQFVRNKALRYWMDSQDVGKYDLSKLCKALAEEFPFAKKLNSMARQASAERAWSSISRFYDNCKKGIKPVGFPRFKKHSRSVEYKTSGWKLLGPKRITFTDGFGIGELRLLGTYDLARYDESLIKRVRLVRRADGYYVQFCIQVDVQVQSEPSQKAVGIDLGLRYFIAASDGSVVEAPQFYRKSERRLNKANREKSRKYRKGAKPQSRNYHRARNRYARKHLRVSRQRNEWAKSIAYCVIQSNDLVAYEDLNVKGLVRNRHLAKSISDAGWSIFRCWLEYFGRKYGKVTIAVPPQYTSQDCSSCGQRVKKALSVRTHHCPHCGYEADRDVNAAINILRLGLTTVGHTGSYTLGESGPLAGLEKSCSVKSG